jgi:hypothetical protein
VLAAAMALSPFTWEEEMPKPSMIMSVVGVLLMMMILLFTTLAANENDTDLQSKERFVLGERACTSSGLSAE